MKLNEANKIDELLTLPKSLSFSDFEEYITLHLERKNDKKLALQELDELIGKLQNHVLILSLYLKQNYLIAMKPGLVTDPGFYTKQEIAILYRVSVRTVTNWVISGLETTLIGGVVRISKQAIHEFVKSNKTKKFNWKSIAKRHENHV